MDETDSTNNNCLEFPTVLRMIESTKPCEIVSEYQASRDLPVDKTEMPIIMEDSLDYPSERNEDNERVDITRLTDTVDVGQSSEGMYTYR